MTAARPAADGVRPSDAATTGGADTRSADGAGTGAVTAATAQPVTAGDEVDAIVAAWQRERPDLDVEPLQVLSRLDRLADVLATRRVAIFAEHGLRRHEFDVLAALRRAGEPFALTAGELAARTYVTSGTMTSRVDGLTARGLVRRSPDSVDGRLVRVELTPAGRTHVDASFGALLAAEQELLGPLDSGRTRELADALRILLDRAGR